MDDDMKLPDGKTCSMCANWTRCKAFICSLTGEETSCDWSPSRFREDQPGLRLIIAGGRGYQCTADDYAFLDDIMSSHQIECVVSGEARGADTCGRNWAESHGIRVAKFPVTNDEWRRHGKAAGPRRNINMAKYASANGNGALVVFPGGRGTQSMRRIAESIRLKIFEPHAATKASAAAPHPRAARNP